jgi:GntR family transcriptional regulator, transcriptional repressor for pyruvate dehydrogenase complex
MSSSAASKLSLDAIPRNRVYTEVARQLQASIVSELKPGDMLPPERELVHRFGVSRSSIRDAIRSLEAVGVLEPRQGIGTVVRALPADVVANPVASILLERRKALHELLEVRLIIEPPLAGRAALHATAEQIEEMEAILDRQTAKLRQDEPATEEDSAFHYAIALAADNGVMLKLVRVLLDLLHEARERSLQISTRQRKSLAGHHRILAALRHREVAAAEAAMRQHILEIQRIVLQKPY